MKTTLNKLVAELNLKISTLCHHLRTKVYAPGSEQLASTISSLILYQILVDELSKLLEARQDVLESLQKFVAGQRYDTNTANRDDTIYEYCLRQFEGDIALGTATEDLTNWVATHADRNQLLRNSFYLFFPDAEMKVPYINEAGEIELRDATEADKFESNKEGFLKDVESSNALNEFNQHMQRVKLMLELEAPVTDILAYFNTNRL